MQKGEPGGSPFCRFTLAVCEAAPILLRWFRERHAPHARCDQLVVCSKPGGVIRLFPWPAELTNTVYAGAAFNTRGKMSKENLRETLWKRITSQTVIRGAGRGPQMISPCETG